MAVRVDGTGPVYTDGTTIFVPDSDPVNQDVLLGLVIQATLVGAGSLEPQIVARLRGRHKATRRYLTLEAIRAGRSLGGSVPKRVEVVLAGCWGGAVPGTARESVQRALTREHVPEAPEVFGTIKPWKLLHARGRDGTASAGQIQRGTIEPPDLSEFHEDDDSEKSLMRALFSSPLDWENPLFQLLRSQLAMGKKARQDSSGGGAELPVRGMSVVNGKPGPHAKAMPAPPGLSLESVSHPFGDAHYPEWDHERQSYRANWCLVGEFDPAPGDSDERLRVGTDPLMRRNLAMLGLGYRRHNRQYEGDDLDLVRLVDFAVARAAGESGDERVYQAQLKTARDLGVAVLLDASGSTAEGQSGESSIWDEQRRLAGTLIATLEDVGDRVAAYGFRSRGRHQVQFLRIKEFDGRFDQRALSRLAALEPSGFTRLGAAIRHATHLLATRAGTSNLLLVVVSDGFPYDDGYEDRYAEHDTRRALDEAIARGVGCVCLSVGTPVEDAALGRVWGNACHLRLTTARELSRQIGPLIRSSLRVAVSG
jgi:hypothetical protein